MLGLSGEGGQSQASLEEGRGSKTPAPPTDARPAKGIPLEAGFAVTAVGAREIVA